MEIKYCLYCGKELPKGIKFCPYCGKELPKGMKFCLYCGKELPKEMKICPHCMKKQIEEKEIQIDETKPAMSKKRWLIFAVGLFVIVILGVVLFAVFRKHPAENPIGGSSSSPVNESSVQSEESSSQPEESSSQPEESSSQSNEIESSNTPELSIDYDKYIGVWQKHQGDSLDESDQSGSITLEIVAINNNIVRFNLTSIQAPPMERVARIENATCEIVDGMAAFSFNNDGWDNSGTGRIIFKEDAIYVETTILYQNESAMWDLNVSNYLKRIDESSRNLDIDYLRADFDAVKSSFGEEIGEVATDDATGFEVHYFGELSVSVDPENNTIRGFSVDYTQATTKTGVHYGDIDGNSIYEDVIANYGQPLVGYPDSSGGIGYDMGNGFLKFGFDENMQVTWILCFAEVL